MHNTSSHGTANPYSSENLDQLVTEALEAISSVTDSNHLKIIKNQVIGDKSKISQLSKGIGQLEPNAKGPAGKNLGEAKRRINQVLEAKEQEFTELEKARILQEETVDITASTPLTTPGARHPLALLQEKVSDIFVSLGWKIADGPEVEHDWINFDALNFPPDHPARAMQDTFFIDSSEGQISDDSTVPEESFVLRTHTSPVQVRAMVENSVPLYVLSPGRVYRTDELDATHTPVFNQIEGLAVDENLSMADLKGTLEYFATAMFGPEAKIRLRPSYFPFTEPSAELDVWYEDPKGSSGWVEWGGCGMVNPNVLEMAGIDSSKYTGFAFGMGVERTLMFRNKVSDMRDMVEGDIRFSQQFGGVV